MEKGLKLDAEDEVQLVNICKQIWKQEKNRGIRFIQKISKKISIAFKNYLLNRYLDRLGKGENPEERSFMEFNIKEQEPETYLKIRKFFIDKELKKYSGGIPQILEEREKEVGIAMVLNTEKEFYEKWVLKKEVKQSSIVLNVNEPLPTRGEGPQPNPEWKKILDEINSQKWQTAEYIYILYKGLALDKYNREFFRDFVIAYSKKLADNFRETEPKKYEFHNANIQYVDVRNEKAAEKFISEVFDKVGYFIWTYDDFIINFFTLIKFFTGLKLTLSIEANNKIFIKFFCTEPKLRGHAEAFEYDLQLKNYGLKYHKLGRELEKQSVDYNTSNNPQLINKPRDSDTDLLLDKIQEDMQFHQFDHDVQFHYPPYENYDTEKDVKFMRYTKNDLYHICPNDPELSRMELTPVMATENSGQYCCSNLRNIDKIRLIFRAFDEVVMLKKLKDLEYLDSIIILRNYNAYKEMLQTENLVWGKANIFNSSSQEEYLQITRNFYGEKISFYFLFIRHYTLWLTFPTLIGLIVFFLYTFKNSFSHVDQNTNMSVMSIILTVYAMMIILWANLFLKVWKQKEKLYSYFWGTENFELEEPFVDTFKKDVVETFLFKFRVKFQHKWKKILKFVVSYLVVAIFCAVVIFLLIFLFKWKGEAAKQTVAPGSSPSKLPLIIGILNGIQIKVMSFIYSYVAVWLTQWENHEKASKFDYSLSLKIIIFEFINNYSSLYYIAFLKKSFEDCKDGNCLSELNLQIYTILATSFFFNLVEIGKPFIMDRITRNSYLKNYPEGKEVDFTPHGMHHQLISEDFSTLRDDYNEMIIQFGYLTFFSVAAPITPLICFILTFIEKFVDAYKMYYLHRVTIIDQANGIGLYNQLLKIWCFIGMTTNIGLVLFTNPDLAKMNTMSKFLIFFIVENAVLVLTFVINWNILPKWFENKQYIPSLYNKNYLNKDYEGLPHHDLYEKYVLKKEVLLNKNTPR